MKKILTFLAIAMMAVIAFNACNKATTDKDPIQAAPNKADAKKVVLSEPAVVGADKVLHGMEFTDGGRYILTYVVTKASDFEYETGSYSVEDGVYVLEGFGRIAFEGNKITITIENADPVEATGTTLPSLPGTEEIAQTWEVKSVDVSLKGSKGSVGFTKQGCNLEEISLFLAEKLEENGYDVDINLGQFKGLTVKYVSFSSSGTFLVEFTNGDAYLGEMSNYKQDGDTYSFHYDLVNQGNDLLNGSADCKFIPDSNISAFLCVGVNIGDSKKGTVMFGLKKVF